MNLSVQLMFAILLSKAIGNGNAKTLYFWYAGQDLNCIIHSDRSNERPFDIHVYPLWKDVQNEIVCLNSSEYSQIAIIKELIEFKGSLRCLESKHKFEELECFKPYTNCKTYEWINNTTLMVSLGI